MNFPQVSEMTNKKLAQGESCVCILFSVYEKEALKNIEGLQSNYQLTYAVFVMIQEYLENTPHLFTHTGHGEGVIILLMIPMRRKLYIQFTKTYGIWLLQPIHL